MRTRPQRGSMLIWALVAFVIVAGVVFAGGTQLRSSADDARTRFRTQGQAQDVARAGLVDAFAWFRRQTTQPVSTFAPQRDLVAVPPINETDDPSIGLVREYEISGGTWGRYEVRLFSDLNANGRWDPGEGVTDVTAERSLPGVGTVWQLEAHGFVFRRNDPNVGWNTDPNSRVSGAIAATEIRRISLLPPGAGALCCDRGDAVTVGSQARVDGIGGGGIMYANSTGTPTIGGQVAGSPSFGSLPGYDATVPAVFGVTLEELKSLATIRLAVGEPLPDPIPDFALIVAEGDITITPAQPLRGNAILVVIGDLTIETNTNSFFAGVIYTTGDYTQQAPSLIAGEVICRGNALVTGAGDRSELVYDSGIIDTLKRNTGQYRLARAPRRLDQNVMGAIR